MAGDRPRILDLFCGAGGCSWGYERAGFEVIGIDINPQPNYPFEFHQADAMTYPLDGFDAVHASPPCQAFSVASAPWTSRLGERADRHDDLLTPTRERLIANGKPWVIENVPGAPMTNYVVLCGSMFGLNVKRHRWFETSFMVWNPPVCGSHDYDFVIVFGGGVRGRAHQIGRTTTGKGGPIIRRSTLPLATGHAAMGIDWMDHNELSQAIPPAYTAWLGTQLLNEVEMAA